MSYLSSRGFTTMILVVVSASLGFNLVQKYEVDRLKVLQSLSREADALNNAGYNELVVKVLTNIREQNLEIVKNQGKIEGMLSVIQNYEPDKNLTSALWHSGYYRGLDQSEYMAKISTENDQPVFPASFTEKPADK